MNGWMRKTKELKDDLLKNVLGTPYVGFVHIRRTDYVDIMNKDYKPGVFQGLHINSLIQRQLTRHSNSVFLILSDENDWCRENIALGPKVLLADTKHMEEVAFALMVQCDFSIITYGSFGLWGGILNGGNMTRLFPKMEKDSPLSWRFQVVSQKQPNVEIVVYP